LLLNGKVLYFEEGLGDEILRIDLTLTNPANWFIWLLGNN